MSGRPNTRDEVDAKSQMGIPLEIFSLYQLQREGGTCQHYLLVRVEQAGYRNADEGEYDYVSQIADQKKQALIAAYQAEVLAAECTETHSIRLVGELQGYPIGDELFEECSGYEVELWIAETRFGYPWVVLGMAEDEAAFWREVEQDEDLARLGARKPARKQTAFFLTEKDNKTCESQHA